MMYCGRYRLLLPVLLVAGYCSLAASSRMMLVEVYGSAIGEAGNAEFWMKRLDMVDGVVSDTAQEVRLRARYDSRDAPVSQEWSVRYRLKGVQGYGEFFQLRISVPGYQPFVRRFVRSGYEDDYLLFEHGVRVQLVKPGEPYSHVSDGGRYLNTYERRDVIAAYCHPEMFEEVKRLMKGYGVETLEQSQEPLLQKPNRMVVSRFGGEEVDTVEFPMQLPYISRMQPGDGLVTLYGHEEFSLGTILFRKEGGFARDSCPELEALRSVEGVTAGSFFRERISSSYGKMVYGLSHTFQVTFHPRIRPERVAEIMKRYGVVEYDRVARSSGRFRGTLPLWIGEGINDVMERMLEELEMLDVMVDVEGYNVLEHD